MLRSTFIVAGLIGEIQSQTLSASLPTLPKRAATRITTTDPCIQMCDTAVRPGAPPRLDTNFDRDIVVTRDVITKGALMMREESSVTAARTREVRECHDSENRTMLIVARLRQLIQCHNIVTDNNQCETNVNENLENITNSIQIPFNLFGLANKAQEYKGSNP